MTRKRLAAGVVAATVTLTGLGPALATPAFAEPHPDHDAAPSYEALADLDGRWAPRTDALRDVDFVKKGRTMRVVCQVPGDSIYGSNIWDLVEPDAEDRPDPGRVRFVPDRFVDTGVDGSSDEIPLCTDGQVASAYGLQTL